MSLKYASALSFIVYAPEANTDMLSLSFQTVCGGLPLPMKQSLSSGLENASVKSENGASASPVTLVAVSHVNPAFSPWAFKN